MASQKFDCGNGMFLQDFNMRGGMKFKCGAVRNVTRVCVSYLSLSICIEISDIDTKFQVF